MKEEEMKEKYVEYKQLDEQIKHIHKQIQVLQNQLGEFASVLQNLDDLNNIKTDSEILVPISSGIFTKARINGTSEFLVNVGSNVLVEKDVQATKNLIEAQIAEMSAVRDKMAADVNQLIQRAAAIEKEFESNV